MTPRTVLSALRTGGMPDPADLIAFATGLANGSVSDAQAGAFAMAVCRGPGLGPEGRVALTRGMADSGRRMSWDLPGPVIDKHSTGGVGDPVSLVLAPMLAAVGAYVPMISGRGLGHTGGTLDKLESIPGMQVELSEDRFRAVVREAGAAIVAASDDIAPADRRLYAIRDVTATVDQIDLITASILSKKLAAGLQALVLDVKAGSGAFMRDAADARALAEALVQTATEAGCPTAALVTAMDEPLAPGCGNALEIASVMETLTGNSADTRLREISLALGGALLARAGQAEDAEAGAARLAETLGDGRAAESFARMVAAQGGSADFADTWRRELPSAQVIRKVTATESGTLVRIDGTALGLTVVGLGGGRQREGDRVDPAVGLDRIARIGTPLAAGDTLARIHAADETAADMAEESLRAAMTLGEAAEPKPLILERIG
ncbi:thymidine phosphorylase [Palleronia sp.]|uniref:thymidine phosphorylase n=1 Tax=Palleronia sp. TaxID=1940284 RepID=UPI0035C7BA81